jgi:hypothetical protein
MSIDVVAFVFIHKELMTSPTHTPMLLFPCGHTFCRECIGRHDSNPRKKPNCPYCRQTVDSMAVNQSLKDLIDNFASQREKVHFHEMQLRCLKFLKKFFSDKRWTVEVE